LAAVGAHWESEGAGRGVPLVLFAVPNEQAERNDYEVAIPRLGSLLLTHSLDGEIQPLKAVPASERPPVKPVLYAFRVMGGGGVTRGRPPVCHLRAAAHRRRGDATACRRHRTVLAARIRRRLRHRVRRWHLVPAPSGSQ